jgi:hypothetical protein
MKTILKCSLFCLAILICACQVQPTPALLLSTPVLPTPSSAPVATLTPLLVSLPALFIDTDSRDTITPPPHVIRSRLVKVNLSLLLDEERRPRPLEPNTEIMLNLFPDLTYTGVIEQIEQGRPGSVSWIGSLKNVEYGRLILVFSSGVFIANISSPEGIYEVSSAGVDLYRVIQIDQSKLSGGEEPPMPTQSGPNH